MEYFKNVKLQFFCSLIVGWFDEFHGYGKETTNSRDIPLSALWNIFLDVTNRLIVLVNQQPSRWQM